MSQTSTDTTMRIAILMDGEDTPRLTQLSQEV